MSAVTSASKRKMHRAVRAALPSSAPKPSGPPRVINKRESADKKAYYEQWTAVLRTELDAARAQFHAVLSNSSREELSSRGVALFGLVAESKGVLFGESVVRLSLPRGANLPRHRFANGDIVLLSRSHPAKDLAMEGVLLDHAPVWLTITTRDRTPVDLANRRWRLDKGDDRATFEQCIAAVKAATGHGFPPPRPEDPSPQPRPLGLSAELLPFFIGDRVDKEAIAKLAASPPPPRLASLYKDKLPPPDFDSWGLNESQKRAVLEIPHRRLSLVRGPPGTGKTRTAIMLIVHLVNMLKGSGITVLATAFTNVCHSLFPTLLLLVLFVCC